MHVSVCLSVSVPACVHNVYQLVRVQLFLWLYLCSNPRVPRRRFSGEDITVSLLNRPNDDLLVSDIESITIWCRRFNIFFGRLDNIPAELTNSLAVSRIVHPWCCWLLCHHVVFVISLPACKLYTAFSFITIYKSLLDTMRVQSRLNSVDVLMKVWTIASYIAIERCMT